MCIACCVFDNYYVIAMRNFLVFIAVILFVFLSCSKDDGLLLERRYVNLQDSTTASIYVNIARIIGEYDGRDHSGLTASVSVTNQSGTVIKDLTRVNFNLHHAFDDNSICEENFGFSYQEENKPLAVVITMDYSGSMTDDDVFHMEQAVREFVRLLKPDDHVQIIKFATEVLVMNSFTDDRSIIMDAIDHSPLPRLATAFYQSIYAGLNGLKDFLAAGQDGFVPVVIAFTDGWDNMSNVGLRNLNELSAQLQVPVYPVGLGNVDEYTMNYIAQRTGGRFFYTRRAEDVVDIFRLISQLMGSYYRLEFVPGTEAVASGVIRLDVSVAYENMLGVHEATAFRHFYFR